MMRQEPKTSFAGRAVAGLLAVLILWSVSPSVPADDMPAQENAAFAQSDRISGYNILLAIDKSGSMGKRIGYVQDAAVMFVQSLYRTVVQERESASAAQIYIAVMEFTNETKIVQKWRILENYGDVEDIAREIRGISVVAGAPTDLGVAVNNAMSEFEGRFNTQKNAVLLFTDGYTDGLASDGEDDHKTRMPPEVGEIPTERVIKGDQYSQSRASLYNGLQDAANRNCDIYAIGFNHENKLSEVGQAWIRYIAETAKTTGLRTSEIPGEGKVNYLITDQMQDVREFYVDVIAAVAQNGQEPYKPHQKGKDMYVIDMDSAVSRAVVYVLSKGETPVLRNPQQKEPANMTLDEGENYYAFTLAYPEAGEWTVGPVDVENVKIRCIIMDGVSLDVSPETIDGRGVVTVRAKFHGEPVDAAFYQRLADRVTCTVTHKNARSQSESEKGDRQEIALAYDAGAQGWRGSFSPSFPGEYDVRVELSSEQKQWTRLSAGNSVDIPLVWREGKDTALQIRVNDKHAFSLAQLYLPKWNSLTVVSNSVHYSPQNKARVVLADSIAAGYTALELEGLEEGETEIQITVMELYSGESMEMITPVEVLAPLPPVPYFALAGLILIVVVAVVAALRRKGKEKKIPENPAPPKPPEDNELEKISENAPSDTNSSTSSWIDDRGETVSPDSLLTLPDLDNEPPKMSGTSQKPPQGTPETPPEMSGTPQGTAGTTEMPPEMSGTPQGTAGTTETPPEMSGTPQGISGTPETSSDEPSQPTPVDLKKNPSEYRIPRPPASWPSIDARELEHSWDKSLKISPMPEGALNVVVSAFGCDEVADEVECPTEDPFTLYSLVMGALKGMLDASESEKEKINLMSLQSAVRGCQKTLESDNYKLYRKDSPVKGDENAKVHTYGYGPKKESLGENRPIFTDEPSGLSIKVWFFPYQEDD